MVKNKKAFTLVETIISMMIIMIVAVASLSGITKTKPRIESVTIRGQYGCWYWDSAAAGALSIAAPAGVSDGDLVEWYFDERTERTNEPLVVPAGQTCKLMLDKRPAHFYILASGAGNAQNPGQVNVSYAPAISNELTIRLGKAGSTNLATMVQRGDQSEIAGGAVPINLDFHPENIKSCFVLKDSTSGGKITSCEVVTVNEYNETTDNYTNTYKVRLNGLEYTNDYGNQEVALVKFSDLSFQGGIPASYHVDFNNIPQTSPALAVISTNHIDSFRIDESTKSYHNSLLTFEHKNSSYVPAKRILNYIDFPNNAYSTSDRSKMTKIIENISVRRASKLTELFKLLNAGGLNKDGAVLILW